MNGSIRIKAAVVVIAVVLSVSVLRSKSGEPDAIRIILPQSREVEEGINGDALVAVVIDVNRADVLPYVFFLSVFAVRAGNDA